MSKSDKCKCKSDRRCGCHDRHDCRCGCRCGCRGDGGFKRRYRTREERISELEEYLKELKAEVRAVEEQLADLKKK
jgi:hypothetical protein